MSKYDVYQKTSWEQKDFDLSFERYLVGTDDLLQSVEIVIDNPELDLVSSNIYPVEAPLVSKVFVEGGVYLHAYMITARATCVSGRKLEHTIVVVIVD